MDFPETIYNPISGFSVRPVLLNISDFGGILDGRRHFPPPHKRDTAGDAARFLKTAVLVCERRRLFLTINEFLVMGPDCVQEGDIVCMLSGGDLPFILRSVQPKPEPHSEAKTTAPHSQQPIGNHYHFDGECYVEGLMKGEVISALDEAKDLIGPVPPDLVVRDIVAQANTPEPFQETDLKTLSKPGRLRRKKEKLE